MIGFECHECSQRRKDLEEETDRKEDWAKVEARLEQEAREQAIIDKVRADDIARERERAEWGTCYRCGQRFVEETRIRKPVGKDWPGLTAQVKDNGVCPLCYHDRVMGSERDWTASEWFDHVTVAIRNAKTESDLDEIEGLVPFPDARERVQAARRDLARVRRLRRKAEIETSLDKVRSSAEAGVGDFA